SRNPHHRVVRGAHRPRRRRQPTGRRATVMAAGASANDQAARSIAFTHAPCVPVAGAGTSRCEISSFGYSTFSPVRLSVTPRKNLAMGIVRAPPGADQDGSWSHPRGAIRSPPIALRPPTQKGLARRRRRDEDGGDWPDDAGGGPRRPCWRCRRQPFPATAGPGISSIGGECMRIAVLAPLVESVPPALYGGTERVVSVLTEQLVRRGHEVTLFASGDSTTAARLVPVVPQ